MNNNLRPGIALCFAIVACWCAPAASASPTAGEIIDKIDALKKPASIEGGMTKAENDAFVEKYNAFNIERAELAKQLWDEDPDNERLLTLLADRWGTMLYAMQSPECIEDEANKALAGPLASGIEKQAIYFRAAGEVAVNGGTADAALKAFTRVGNHLNTDKRYLRLMSRVIAYGSAKARLEIMDRLEPRTKNQRLLDSIAEQRKALAKIGAPVELAFNDAITNKPISIKALRGKVVVLDFWATWCGPCVAELPHLKEIYTEYKDRGIEIIGVSLDFPEDKGGLTKLRTFVKKNNIPWPQYYQGKGWASEFSSSWGIDGIPALFLIDQQGNLHSLDARNNLAEQLDALLEK
jgi:thiol-disulfide isomerase/thioredoxin